MNTDYIDEILQRAFRTKDENLSDKSARIAIELNLVIEGSDIWTEYRSLEDLANAHPQKMTFSGFFAAVIALAIKDYSGIIPDRDNHRRCKNLIKGKWVDIRKDYNNQLKADHKDFYKWFAKDR
jgi:hypothetical protein